MLEADFESDAIRRVFGTMARFKEALNLAGTRAAGSRNPKLLKPDPKAISPFIPERTRRHRQS
jgi:hypothetical protein